MPSGTEVYRSEFRRPSRTLSVRRVQNFGRGVSSFARRIDFRTVLKVKWISGELLPLTLLLIEVAREGGLA